MPRTALAILTLISTLPGTAALSAAAEPAPPGQAGVPVREEKAPVEAAPAGDPGEGGLPVCCADWASQIVCMNGYRRAPVVSAWLKNGVRVHHLRLESMPEVVFVTVSFSGGELLESAGNRGVSLGACSAWDGLSSAALEGRDVHVEAIAGPDAIQLRIWGRRDDIDEGLRVASAMLDRPKVTQAALASTMRQGSEQIQARTSAPAAVVADAIAEAIFPPDEARARPMTKQEGDRVTVGEAQQWLEKHIADAPIEVSMVGDLTLEEAMRLGAGYLGRLPARERPSPNRFAEARRLPPPAYPIRAEVRRAIDPGSAIVVVGFPGADAPNIPDLRTMRVAARVLDERVTAELRRAGFDDAEATAATIPGTVYPGFGVVVASFKTTAERAVAAAGVMEGVVAMIASGGVSDGEVQAAGDELWRAVERFEKEPRYWMGILARAESSGLDPNVVADGANFYRSVNAETVSAAIKRNVGEGRILRLIIHPADPVVGEGDGEGGSPGR